MKKIWMLCLLTVTSLFLLAGCSKKENPNNTPDSTQTDSTQTDNTQNSNPNYDSENYLTGTHYAIIDVKGYGEISIALSADLAPATVTNFVNLVKEGFYDGLTFHRVIDGFMIQGGDPKANGTGGSKYTVPGEFADNGFEGNTLTHVRGTISMARSDKYDSASSQFFIMHEDRPDLDNSYAAFGSTIFGFEVIDAICKYTPVTDDNGTVTAENQPVITSIRMVEKTEAFKENEEARPDATASIVFTEISDAANIEVAASLVADENGKTYYISSSEDLLSLSIYAIDLSTGVEYNVNPPIVSFSDVGANTFVSVKINIPVAMFPELILVAEEHNGAIGEYLINLDSEDSEAYLVPMMNQ